MGSKRTTAILMTGLAALLTIARSVSSAEIPTTQPAEVPDELKFLIAENEKSFKESSWVSYHSEQLYTNVRWGGKSCGVTKDVFEQFPYMHVKCRIRNEDPANPKASRETSAVSVVGDDYFAYYEKGRKFASCLAHESINHRSEASLALDGATNSIDLMFYGAFGLDGYSLSDWILDRPPGSVKWTVSESVDNGEHLFVVEGFRVRDAAQGPLFDRSVISADKGFLITHYEFYSGGEIYREGSVTVQKFGPEGMWFPTRLEQKEYDSKKGDDGKIHRSLGSTLSAEISEIIPKPKVPDGEFTLASLGFGDGERVIYTTTTGDLEGKIWTDNHLVPDLSVATVHPGKVPVPRRTSAETKAPESVPAPLRIVADNPRPAWQRVFFGASGGALIGLATYACLFLLGRARKWRT